MVRPPPRSTPFPYTALFRSLVIGGWSQLRVTGSKHILQLRRTGDPRTETVRLALIWREQNLDPGRIFFRASSGIQNSADRKSTRLNSSHLVIPNAGFCLHTK